MKIAVIGAGVGGMAAALDLRAAGNDVTIFEANAEVGGLARGFRQPGWSSSLEHFYHHWFTSDADMLRLMDDLGVRQKVIFRRPKTVVFHEEKFYPLDSPLAALTFPGFTLVDMVRFGLVTVFLRYLADWKPLEKVTADEWMRRWYGERLYSVHFEPLLQGKFGPFAREVNMAWFWARFKVRSTRLGTYQGGFQAFNEEFAEILRGKGVQVLLNTAVERISPRPDGGLDIRVNGESQVFDQALVTVSPALMAKMAPDLPQAYLDGLLRLKSMGAVVLIASLKRPLSREGYYWYNIPKVAGFPYLALVEHTNFVPASEFGGDTILYCGDYLETSHEHFSMSKEQLLERFMPSFQRINPDFQPDWVKETWLFRTSYAQPVPQVNHSANIPNLRTPLKGLYFASMSQVYPWDRGTNFAVQVARRAARWMMEDQQT